MNIPTEGRMRCWRVLGLVVVAVGLVGCLSVGDRVAAARRPLAPECVAGDRCVQGTVRDVRGPVAGARVVALKALEGESPWSAYSGPCMWALVDGPVELRRDALEARLPLACREAPVLGQATTLADGSFTLGGLPTGTFTLWAESPDGSGVREAVAAGGSGVELRLGEGVWVSGPIVENPHRDVRVPGACITLISKSHHRFFDACADDTGHFRVGPLVPGRYMAITHHPGHVFNIEDRPLHASEETWVAGIDRPRRVEGRVLLAGAPVAGVEVRLEMREGSPVLRTTTDAEGRFSFVGIRGWLYELSASHAGNGAWTVASFGMNGELPASEGNELVLAPVAWVEGVVRDAAGRPSTGARVSASWEQRHRNSLHVQARTDAEGRYRLGPLRSGKVGLWVSADGHQPVTNDAREFSAGAHALDFTLAPEVLIEGLVLSADGQPLEGGMLEVRGTDGRPVPGVGGFPKGRFSLRVPTPGPYRLRLYSNQHRETWVQLEVTAPARELILTDPGPSIRGVVMDEAGRPMPDVGVALWKLQPQPDEDSLDFEITDSRGGFLLHAPAPGRYRLMASESRDGSLALTSMQVEVGKGSVAEARMRFEPWRRRMGVVVDQHGQPVPQVFVGPSFVNMPRQWLAFHESFNDGTTTDGAGRFTVWLAGGPFDLRFGKSGYVHEPHNPHSEERRVREAPGTGELRFTLWKQGFVRGRIVDEEGRAIRDFLVNGERVWAREGAFSLPFVDAGTLPLEVSARGYRPYQRSVPVQESEDVDLGTVVLLPE